MKIYDAYHLHKKKAQRITYLVENFIPLGIAGDIYSPPDTGKTTILLSLLSAIANCESHWFGYKLVSGRVAFVGGEKSDESVWVRDIQRATNGINDPNQFVIFDLTSEHDEDEALWTWTPKGWIETLEYQKLLEQLKTFQPVVTVLDTISCVAMGSEPIDNLQQIQLANQVRKLQRKIGGTLLTISHTNQSSQADSLTNRLHYTSRSGANGYPGRLRWLLGMSNLTATEKETLGIDQFSKVVALGVSKHNEMPMPMPIGNRFNPLLLEITKTGEVIQVAKNCTDVEMPSRRENMKTRKTAQTKKAANHASY